MISMLRESCLFSVGSLFPLEDLEAQGSCYCGASLPWRRGKVIKVQPLLLPLMKSVLVTELQGAASASPSHSKILSVVSCS